MANTQLSDQDIENQFAQEQNQAPQASSATPAPMSDAAVESQFSNENNQLDNSIENQFAQEQNQVYATPGQQALTVAEGAGRGFAGPLATGAEWGLHKLGLDKAVGLDLSPEAQQARRQANPIEAGASEAAGLAAGLLTGAGEAGLIAKATARILPIASEVGVLAKAGTMAFRGAIESGLIQAGDETSKAMLGQGDPASAIAARIAQAAVFGGGVGFGFNMLGSGVNKSLEAIKNSELANRAPGVLAGMKAASLGDDAVKTVIDGYESAGAKVPSEIKAGILLYKKGIDKGTKLFAGNLAGIAGATVGGVPGYILGKGVEAIFNKPISNAVKYAAMKAIASGETGALGSVARYAGQVAKGQTVINKTADSIFRSTGQQMINYDVPEKARNQIKDMVETNDLDLDNTAPISYAEGGVVAQQPEEDPIARVYPEQAIAMAAAKGRVYNYLNSLRPLPPPTKLPYDTLAQDTMKDRNYDNALDIATNPISVVKHIKSGTLQKEHVQHLNNMYPELHNELSKRITKNIMESNLHDEKLPYKTRMSLSLFLGTPLDSTMTPASIQAAQPAPQMPSMPMPAKPGRNKKSTSNLGKSNKSYMTTDQSAEADRSSRT